METYVLVEKSGESDPKFLAVFKNKGKAWVMYFNILEDYLKTNGVAYEVADLPVPNAREAIQKIYEEYSESLPENERYKLSVRCYKNRGGDDWWFAL